MNKVLVETSARHVHLSAADIETLFGAGATLTHKKDLSQPGQFACEERVTLVGPKKSIANVIILGPARPATQVEVSFTDARTLGVAAPVRECLTSGPNGSCRRTNGRNTTLRPKTVQRLALTSQVPPLRSRQARNSSKSRTVSLHR